MVSGTGDQVPSRSPQNPVSRTKDSLITQEILRDLGALYQERGPRPDIRTKHVLSVLITLEITGCKSPVSGTCGPLQISAYSSFFSPVIIYLFLGRLFRSFLTFYFILF